MNKRLLIRFSLYVPVQALRDPVQLAPMRSRRVLGLRAILVD
jgi:hypothetical protein